jgi:hypothetical protein
MPPVISAVLAFMASPFQSRASLYLEHVALRHQLAVYQCTIHRVHLRPTDCLLWGWLSRLWSTGKEVLMHERAHGRDVAWGILHGDRRWFS